MNFQSVETEHAERKLRLYLIGYELGRPGGPAALVEGRPIARSRFEMVADRRTGLQLGDRVRLGRDHLRGRGPDQQTRSPPAATRSSSSRCGMRRSCSSTLRRRRPACSSRAAAQAASQDTSTRWSRASLPKAGRRRSPQSVRRWKHLAALTQAEQETHPVAARWSIARAGRSACSPASCCWSPPSSSRSSSTP